MIPKGDRATYFLICECLPAQIHGGRKNQAVICITRLFASELIHDWSTAELRFSAPILIPRDPFALNGEHTTVVFTAGQDPMLQPQTSRERLEEATVPPRLADRVTISGIKWRLDGSHCERSAATRNPYFDDPTTSGQLNFPPHSGGCAG